MGGRILNVFAIKRSCLSRVFGLGLAISLIFVLFLGLSTSRGTAYANGGWDIETVDSNGDVGSFVSLALDESGYTYITYYDYTNWILKYAYQDANGWNFDTTATDGGIMGSLALDGSVYPHIAFYDDIAGLLKHEYKDASGWHSETVDGGMYVGLYPSLAIDEEGGVHIGYYNNALRNLRYAYQDSSGWNIETVDTDGGAYTFLALDGTGYPHISYYDESGDELKYAYQDSGGWHIETVDSNGDVGSYTSLALDGTGYPHISYYDNTNGDLMYAYQDVSSWHIETVDSNGDVGSYTSLAIDVEGYVHISYYDNTNGDLMYAYQDVSSWHIETVDSNGDVGTYTSLAIDGEGYVHIGYYDGSNEDLKYARLSGETPEPNNPPTKPILSSPANGTTNVSLTPTLKTAAFSDPDTGDTHLQSEWQLSTETSFSSLILHTTSASYLTSLPVSQYILSEGATYYWRVKFYDNHSDFSIWSDVYSFTTLTTTNDQNSNGIPDSQENNTVDLDNDGTPDIEQTDIIKSLNTVIGDGQMGVSLKDDPTVTSIESIDSIDPETISKYARPYSMSLGLFTIRLTVANPGDTAEVVVYFSQAAPNGTKWYMYNSIDKWIDYSEHATFSADRKSVTLELKDGDYGDADGIANGIIVDPGGFGLASWIEGLIYDSSTSQGIAQAQVSIWDLALSTALDGHYLSMILPGTYTFAVSASGYNTVTCDNVVVPEGGTLTKDVALSSGESPGYMVTSDLWIRAVINTEEKGPVEAVWQKGGQDTTSRGDTVIWGHFYASPSDVTWGSSNNPDLFVKIWFDVNGRIDVNFFHVSVPDITVYSDYTYDGTPDEQGTTTTDTRYIRQYYESGQSYSTEQTEDGNPPSGYSQTGNPSGYSTINDLRIGSIINTVEKGPIDAIWQSGGQDTTSRGDQVVWGHFYANPSDVTWGSSNNPDLFMKIWFDVSGRVDVNFFHVSVPDIEVYSDLPSDGIYDQKGTTIMDNRYIRHEYWN